MYLIKKAAAILGRSERTIRNWMKQCGLKMGVVVTDRKRVYITDDDMNILFDYYRHKKLKKGKKTVVKDKTHRKVITDGEDKYYSVEGAASLLGVSPNSVRRWSRQDGIEQRLIKTDRNRAYISHDDVLRLAEGHGRKVSPKVLVDVDMQRDANTIQPDMDKLCTLKEVGLYLDISSDTVRMWIRQANIERKTKFMGREFTCITYGDVLRLADLHGREVVPYPPSLTVAEEIKEIREILKRHESDIEDIKHDLRLLAKRSIYIG
jgi:transposase-like protein